MDVEFPIIRTNRYLLRQFAETDLENVFTGLSHPDVIKYYGVNFTSLEATKKQMKWFAELENNGAGIWWAVCSPDNTIFYGAGGLYYVNKEHKKAEIGFWLLPDYWKNGMMTEIIPVIVNYGFDQMGLHRIEGFVESGNFNCKNAMAKLNFTHEGTMTDCEVKKGNYISLDIYAKINETDKTDS
jgi:ribosomal-protein-alanine N-acetyltransferase